MNQSEELFRDYFHTLIKEELKKNYDDLKPHETDLALTEAFSKILQDEELQYRINSAVRDACSDVFYYAIEPLREVAFDTPNPGDVNIASNRDRDIQILHNKPDVGVDTFCFNGYSCPFYWLIQTDYPDTIISDTLHKLRDNLPLDEEIKFPFVQAWHSLKEWHIEGYNDDLLHELEMILEGNSQDELTSESDALYLTNLFNEKAPIARLYEEWPNWIKSVDGLELTDREDKEITCNISMTLRNNSPLKIRVKAKEAYNYGNGHKAKAYKWQVYSWTAIDKGFPIFSNKDNDKINSYINETVLA